MPLISKFLSHQRILDISLSDFRDVPQIRRLNRPLLASHTRGYDG
jgi:hypothetical protein